ncbi:MAG: GNAT family N-acetyltransferase [Candidatus Kerfeldbacteria bacterium]|jgi:RimJ/RimL family protein N-acetyltransferase
MLIITKKFTLRPFKKTDAKDIAKFINDKTIYMNTLHIPYPYRLKDAKEWLAKIIPQYRKEKSRSFHLAIEINKEVVGCVGLMEIQGGHKAELGYWLARKHWKKGIMSEAVKEMILYGFKRFVLVRIYAHVFKHNKSSQKILIKNGFKKEGIAKKGIIKDSKFLDEILFAKIIK